MDDMATSERFGVDIGGSGIKGAPVDVATGTLTTDRLRVPTPDPSQPDRVAAVVGDVVAHFDWKGPVGCTFPGVVRAGVTWTAANVDRSWVGKDAARLFSEATGCDATVLNDADAAGLAEITFGAGRGRPGVVIVVTLGTGIGTAVFLDGRLLPNTELGHIEIKGKDAESHAAESVKDRKGLSWERWADRLQEYFGALENLFSPDLFVVGGGVSRKSERFLPLLDLRTEIVPAQLRNEAGIVGAACAARS